MVRLSFVFLFLSALVPGFAIAQSLEEPTLSGYVTRSTSPSDFDANGLHVILGPKTTIMHGLADSYGPRISGGQAFFGERVDIYGKIDRKKYQIEAKEVVFYRFKPQAFSGFAVIDRILSSSVSGQLIVRADGYRIEINSSSTRIDYTDPLSSLSEIKPNIWLEYHGTRASDGRIVADAVAFEPNDVSNREFTLLKRNEYDPSKVPADSKQNPLRKQFLGLDPKKIPPYVDPVMQARVDRIGSRLIPDFQRNLPNDDPAKISFRFQLIDNPKFHDALTLPSGIILIPRQIVERLPEDSQLAAVLADNMATALEKQTYRLMPVYAVKSSAQVAADIGGIFVPGLGLATGIANYASTKSIQTDVLEQSGRVSLGLLSDAGYDIQQAPVAWWTLATKPSKTLKDTAPPPRASNLYRTIGLVWQNSTASQPPASTPASSSVPAIVSSSP